MTITLENESGLSFDFPDQRLAEETVEAALTAEEFPYEAEVNILLVTKEEIQAINRQTRQIDAVTDVLSFPLMQNLTAGAYAQLEEDADNFNPDTGEALLGDVILCAEKIKEQAEAYGHSQKREFCFLIVHSILHLLGYDHMTEEDKRVMRLKEEEVMDRMNLKRQ